MLCRNMVTLVVVPFRMNWSDMNVNNVFGKRLIFFSFDLSFCKMQVIVFMVDVFTIIYNF